MTPGSTMSRSAPAGKATTGQPQASASIATSELVSGTRLGTSRTAGRRQEPALACEAERTEEPGVAAEPWRDLLRKILLVGFIREYLTGDQQRRAGESGRVERQMKAFFRADAPECEDEIASGVVRPEAIDRHAVRDRVEHVRERRETALLVRRHALKPGTGARGESLGR